MSDTFDHEGDAWASLDWEEDPNEEPQPWKPIKGWGKRRYSGNQPLFSSDPLYYHTRVPFKEIKAETEKSCLISTQWQDVWIPKKICRSMDLKGKSVYIHSGTLRKILANK